MIYGGVRNIAFRRALTGRHAAVPTVAERDRVIAAMQGLRQSSDSEIAIMA